MKKMNEVYNGNFVSNEVFKAEDNTGEFEYQVCTEIIDLSEATGEIGFLIIVNAVILPEYLTPKQLVSVKDGDNEVTTIDINQYGISAPLESFKVETDKEVEDKLTYIDGMIPAYGGLIGFYLDKQVNRIGNTGWDFIRGNIG